jgi:hypothetical protein
VTATDADHVTLSWTTEQVEAAPGVERTDFVSRDNWPPLADGWDVGVHRVLSWPYYPYTGLGLGGVGDPYGYGSGQSWGQPAQVSMTYDRVPTGTIEVRRASKILSSDGHIVGHIDGFLVDPTSKITHLVLEHGHLCAHRDITIPITEIEQANSDTVQLAVTRADIDEYPSVPFNRRGHAPSAAE